MGLILLIIVLIILLFYKRNIIKRLHNSFAQNSLKKNTPDYIRNNWQKVCIDADHCDVMNENTTFDLHAVEDNRMKSDFEETMLFTEAMLFNKLQLGEEKNETQLYKVLRQNYYSCKSISNYCCRYRRQCSASKA